MKKINRTDTRYKSKLRKANFKQTSITDMRQSIPSVSNINEYAPIRDNENTLDGGEPTTIASMNDFLKGYNINPYEFQQWASAKHKKKYASMTKQGSGEVFVMQFSPEFLADRILTLWNGADGSLQNFFEAFTLRYNNNLKQQIASALSKQGYQVFPILTDDKPRYAQRLEKLMTKVANSRDLNTILHFAQSISRSDALKLFAGELTDMRDYHHPVSMKEANGILEYYHQCYPEDYALKLVSGLMNSRLKPRVEYERFNDHDWDISDASLQKIEDYMSGNANPTYIRDGGINGWDFTTDARSFDGTFINPTYSGTYTASMNKRLNRKGKKINDMRADKQISRTDYRDKKKDLKLI